MQEITVEKIKDRVKDNLKRARERHPNIDANNSPAGDIHDGSTIARKSYYIILTGIIYRIIQLSTIVERGYYFMVKNTISQDSISTIKKLNLFIKRLPIVGFISWWIYMVLKTPSKISQLFNDIAELKNKTTADIAELKNKTTADIAELKNKTTADIAELKNKY
ncbi:MAG: hypothetical protein HY097_10995, partial [Nitrospinae bacterium]|nr:hypothetical protein [Nitrospinota bacterium]